MLPPRPPPPPGPTPHPGALWGTTWRSIPPGIARHLGAGGAALDVGCGSGLACLALAEALPAARVMGQDPDPGAITRARRLARAARLHTRVSFAVADSTRLPRATYHLVTVQDLRLRAAQPLRILNAIRNALTPEGICLLLETVGGDDLGASDGLPALAGLTSRAGFSRFRALTHEEGAHLFELRR